MTRRLTRSKALPSAGLLVLSLSGPSGAGAAEPCVCPCDMQAAKGSSTPAFVIRPTAEAFERNRAGFAAYRQRQFVAARASYQSAIDADPSFLAPRLNIVCALVQEERFADAVQAADELVRRGFVPWAREIEQAADLAPLRIRPEFQTLRSVLARAGQSWGAALFAGTPALTFVARTGPPVALAGTGVLVLSPAQEVFAYLPDTGTHRQLTSEDGRVLAAARSPDGQHLVYVRGSKLIRAVGQPDRLRGLTVRRLRLTDMTLGTPATIPGDVERLALGFDVNGDLSLSITADTGSSRFVLRGDVMSPVIAGKSPREPVVLTAAGVLSKAQLAVASPSGGCRFTAKDDVPQAGGLPQVAIVQARRRFTLAGPHGTGLHGLPFENAVSPKPAGKGPQRK